MVLRNVCTCVAITPLVKMENMFIPVSSPYSFAVNSICHLSQETIYLICITVNWFSLLKDFIKIKRIV